MPLTAKDEMPLNCEGSALKEVAVSESSRRDAHTSPEYHLEMWRADMGKLQVKMANIEMELSHYSAHNFSMEQAKIMNMGLRDFESKRLWFKKRGEMAEKKSALMEELRETRAAYEVVRAKIRNIRDRVNRQPKPADKPAPKPSVDLKLPVLQDILNEIRDLKQLIASKL